LSVARFFSKAMVEKESVNITEDEAALYDRQIRLWGLDAQKRWIRDRSYSFIDSRAWKHTTI